MGSTVSAGEESSERDPSPDYYGGSKKRPLGDDPHPVSIGEKKKGLPDDPVDERKNRLATSQLVSRLLGKHKFHKLWNHISLSKYLALEFWGKMCSENCFMKTSNETYTLIMCLKLAKDVLNHSDENHIRLKEMFEMNILSCCNVCILKQGYYKVRKRLWSVKDVTYNFYHFRI